MIQIYLQNLDLNLHLRNSILKKKVHYILCMTTRPINLQLGLQ